MVVEAEVKEGQGRPLFGVHGEVRSKELDRADIVIALGKRGRGGTEDEAVKPLMESSG